MKKDYMTNRKNTQKDYENNRGIYRHMPKQIYLRMEKKNNIQGRWQLIKRTAIHVNVGNTAKSMNKSLDLTENPRTIEWWIQVYGILSLPYCDF